MLNPTLEKTIEKIIETATAKAFAQICVVGIGYIGLPTAATLAARGIPVVGLDIDLERINLINNHKLNVIEPRLDNMLQQVIMDGMLRLSHQAEPADAFLIAVPTPFTTNHQPDLNYIAAACHMIAPVLKSGDLVILESTSPVGTTEKLADWLSATRADLSFPQHEGETSDIRIAYCPERVMPGNILNELIKNDRIIGGMTPKCASRALQLYKIFVEGNCMVTQTRTAELCKLTENSFRDVNIAFANELSILCDKLNVDVWELIYLANHHPRVNILQPGPGVGGHCIPVDPWFIVSQNPEARLIHCAREINEAKQDWVLHKTQRTVTEFLQENPTKQIKNITIGCLGLAFKADVDDCRESPAIKIVEAIVADHAGPVMVVEPYISVLPSTLKNKALLQDLHIVLAEVDILLILVAHKQFLSILPNIRQRNIKIIDTIGILSSYSLYGQPSP